MGGPIAHANIEGQEWVFHHGGQDRRFAWIGRSRGTPLIPLAELTKAYGLELRYDPVAFKVTVRNPKSESRVTFHTFSRTVEGRLKGAGSVTGFTIHLSKAPQFEGLKLCVPIDFGDRALRPLLTGLKPSNPLVRKLELAQVVIDPGHGGNDYGASFRQADGIWVREKDLALTMAWELREALRKTGVASSLTREDDSFLTLPERSHLANVQKAKLFVSLHLNSNPEAKSHGFEVYVLSLVKSDEEARAAIAAENQMIPEDLSDGVDKALGELRAEANLENSLAWAKLVSAALSGNQKAAVGKAVRTGPFYVLYGAEMPALLLESGYLTSESDRQLLLNGDARKGMMKSLAQGISKELTKGLTNPAKEP